VSQSCEKDHKKPINSIKNKLNIPMPTRKKSHAPTTPSTPEKPKTKLRNISGASLDQDETADVDENLNLTARLKTSTNPIGEQIPSSQYLLIPVEPILPVSHPPPPINNDSNKNCKDNNDDNKNDDQSQLQSTTNPSTVPRNKDKGEQLDLESAKAQLNAICTQLEQGEFLRTASNIAESARGIVQHIASLTANLTAFKAILPVSFPLTQLERL
jgi:hypothetical protein